MSEETTKRKRIRISKFDLLKERNEKANNTHHYDTDKLVLRRGNDCKVQFKLSRAFDKKTDALNVEFRRGSNPQFREGTRFECLIERRAVREWEWKGTIDSSDGKVVTASLHVPVDAPIGEYEMVAEAVDLELKKRNSENASTNAVILFNPWDKDDAVYLEDDKARNEYVLQGNGKIWAGVVSNPFVFSWEFAQFESYSLNSALYLLDRFGLNSELRRSPVHVSRTCTTMVNFNDNDGGILFGNWSGNYAPYTSPSAWSGSGAILEQYWRTKSAVKWAQCWVFGGTLTSVLRALGIPARPITNYVSVHDTNANRSFDRYLDDNYKPMSHVTADSVWNYHVWVEGWMERPDLKGAYGGWQALDATPQEPSPDTPGNVHTLGPAPVSGIKEGQNLKYDSEFVISEVNADVTYYLYNNGNPKYLTCKTTEVGRDISTKKILSDDREFLTDNYKYTEGSMEERVAFEDGHSTTQSDISVDIIAGKNVQIGQNLEAKVVFKSSASSRRNVAYTIYLRPVSYIGEQGEVLKKMADDIRIKSKDDVKVPIVLTPNEYVGKVSEQLLVDIIVFASITDTETNLIEKETFRFRTPDLIMNVPDEVKVGQPTSVTASFRNPLDQWLTNVEWFVEGAGLTKPLTIDERSVSPGGEGSVTFDITAKNDVEPTRTLTVTFESTQLEGVMGSAVIRVKN